MMVFHCLGLLCLLLSNNLVAKVNTLQSENPEQVQEALSEVQTQIQKLEKNIYHSHHQEKTLNEHLAILEKEIGDRCEQLRQLEKKMTQHTDTVAQLQKQEEKLQIIHKSHQASLSQLIQTIYIHQNKEKLQLLLTPNEWPTIERLNHFYQAFYNAREQHITHLENHLKQIQLLQQHILEEQVLVKALASNVKGAQRELEEKKLKRKEILATLSKEREGAAKKLTKLQQQEKHLSGLVKILQEKLSANPTYVEPSQNFAKMKQQLTLPIAQLSTNLAAIANLKNSDKKSYIDAAAGTPVNSIFGGRVVFAEWLRGVGLLIIVDHGNGYMSLYGNNQKLYKGLGDWVNQGEMIARVGQSGGHAQPGLYFEIRKDGEAIDPTPWFKQG